MTPTIDQPGRPALPLDRLGGLQARRPARARAAGVRHAAAGGLRARQAPRHGLRDDHRSRHDRRRARARRALRRRVRLRGAHRLVSRRAAGGAHPLLGHHPGRPRAPAGARRRRRGRRRRACRGARSPARSRTRSTPSRRRCCRATAAASRSCSRSGRRATARAPGAELARRGLHRDARRHRRRRLRRPRRRRHRPHVHADAAVRDVARVPRPRRRAAPPRRSASTAARRSGRTRRWRSPPARWAAAPADGAAPDPAAIFTMVQRLMREGDARSSHTEHGPLPRRRPRAAARLAGRGRARPRGERAASPSCSARTSSTPTSTAAPSACTSASSRAPSNAIAASHAGERATSPATASALFDACLAAIPYAPAAAFLGREKAKLARREGEPLRVALVADAVGGMHGVTHTLDELRERGVPGFEVEVVGTDHNVDRRLSAVAEIDIPFYAGLKVGVPSLPAIVEALADGRYDLVHLCSPGPSGAAAALIARAMGVPILGSYHTELAAYAGLRTQDPRLELAARMAIGAFYGQCRRVLSPSTASDAVLREMGIADERIGRWDRGVDLARFSPARRDARPAAGRDHRALRRAAHAREGRRPARRRVPAGPGARPAPAPRARRRRARGGPCCAPASASTRRSSAGSRATRSPRPTRAPTSSSSPAARTRSARSCSRRRRAGCRSSPSARAGRRASSPTRSPAGCARADAGALADAVVELAAAPAQRERLARNALRAVARAHVGALAAAPRRRLPPRARPGRRDARGSAVPREAAVLAARRRLRPRDPRGARRCARSARAPLRVADVALFYGERSGGIRTYLDAKAAWAQRSGLIEHHVIVPGPRRAPRGRPPRAAVAAPGGDQRLPAAARRAAR